MTAKFALTLRDERGPCLLLRPGEETSIDSGRRPGPACPVVSPPAPVAHHPIEQRPLETDVMARLFALDPFVPQDLFPLGKKLTIQHGVADKAGTLVRAGCHKVTDKHKDAKSQGGGPLRDET